MPILCLLNDLLQSSAWGDRGVWSVTHLANRNQDVLKHLLAQLFDLYLCAYSNNNNLLLWIHEPPPFPFWCFFLGGEANRLQNCSEGDDARMTCKTLTNGQRRVWVKNPGLKTSILSTLTIFPLYSANYCIWLTIIIIYMVTFYVGATWVLQGVMSFPSNSMVSSEPLDSIL